MTWGTYGAYVLFVLLVLIVPGPDTALVLKNSLAGGRRGGVLTALGIGSGNLAQGVAAALGLSAVIVRSEPVFLTLRWAGAAYLGYLGVIGLVPMGPAGVFVVLLIYLVEAIAYSAIQRRRRGAQSGPAGLQVLSGCVATILILAGIVGLSSSSESLPTVPILAISLGIGIVAWVWYRVSRASGEDNTTIVVGRVAGIVGRSGGSLVVTLVVRLIFVAVVAGATWLIAVITKLFD